jgi:hypothetical protein
LAEINTADPELAFLDGGFSLDAATQLKNITFDRETIAARGLPYEQLDQWLVEILLGIRC